MTNKATGRSHKKIAVILNGCGHRDGSELHEAVLTLLAIEEAGATWEALALDANQAAVLNHIDGAVDRGATPRNMLKESARIARGRIKNLADASPEQYAGVVIPGGNGTASNLCNFASAGKDMTVDSHVVKFLEAAHAHHRPIGAICIWPMLVARVFDKNGVRLTLGDADCGAAKAAATMGARPQACAAEDCIVDEGLRVVTTPAYMLEAGVAQIAIGIRALVNEVVRMAPNT